MINNALMRAVGLAAACTLLPAGGNAQEAPPGALTLSSAVDMALRNHPATREARAGATAASQEIGVARMAYLPRLDLLWQANRATRNNVFGLLLPQTVVPGVSGPVLATDTLDSVWNSVGGLLMSWEAADFGRRGALVDQARAEAALAGAERAAAELDVAGAAADAFLRVLAADATLSAARANLQRLEVFGTTVRALVQNQLRAGVEQSRAEAELAVARNRVTEAQQHAQLARVSLAEAIGMPGAAVDVDGGSLLQPPPRPPGAVFDATSHPRAMAADARVDAAHARDRVLDASYRPRVELQGALSGRGVSSGIDNVSNGSGLGWQVPNWALGMSVTFPSLEIFRTQARRRVEASRLEAVTAHYDRTVQTLQAQEARARAITEAAIQIAANTPQQLQAARDTDTQARARYEAGLTTVIEVADAQRLLTQAEVDSAVANLAVWRALLTDAVLKGDVSSFVNSVQAAQTTSIR